MRARVERPMRKNACMESMESNNILLSLGLCVWVSRVKVRVFGLNGQWTKDIKSRDTTAGEARAAVIDNR